MIGCTQKTEPAEPSPTRGNLVSPHRKKKLNIKSKWMDQKDHIQEGPFGLELAQRPSIKMQINWAEPYLAGQQKSAHM